MRHTVAFFQYDMRSVSGFAWETLFPSTKPVGFDRPTQAALRAPYQRRKERDLFDLWQGLTEGRADATKVVDMFQRYVQASGPRVSRDSFMANLAEKRKHPDFSGDLLPLLVPGSAYAWDTGFALAEERLFKLLS